MKIFSMLIMGIKNLFAKHKNSFADFFPFSILIIAAFACYRLNAWFVVQNMPELSELSFYKYAIIAARGDAVIVLLSISVLLLILAALKKFRKLRGFAAALFTTALCAALLTSSVAFRLYETALQKSMLTDEFFSGWNKIASSMLTEVSAGFFILCFIAVALPAGAAVFTIIEKRLPDKITPLLKIYIPSLFCLLCLSALLFNPAKLIAKTADSISTMGQKQARTVLKETTGNPIYSIIFGETDANGTVTSTQELTDDDLGFNTDSIILQKRTQSIPVIQKGKRYNIILYLFESTSYKTFTENTGNFNMPVWKRLLQNAILFENHYANYPLSANALLSLLTSAYEYPAPEIAIQNYPELPLKTIPEILRSEGYKSMIIHAGDLRYANQREYLKGRFDVVTDSKTLSLLPPYFSKIVGWGLDDRAMIAPVADFIKSCNDNPFFITVMPVNPHHPYSVPDDFLPPANDLEQQESTKQKYLRSLHYADDTLGRLVDTLETQGLMENTLLFLLADHGEAFYEHRGNYNHPFFLYEENVHVPFIIYSKDLIKQSYTVQSVTRHIDILPTIEDLLGLPRLPEQEGISVLAGRKEQLALLYANMRYELLGIRDGNLKYILRLKDFYEELYDLSADPDEQLNTAENSENLQLVSRYNKISLDALQYKQAYYKRTLKGLKSKMHKSIFNSKEMTYEEYSEIKRKAEEQKARQSQETDGSDKGAAPEANNAD